MIFCYYLLYHYTAGTAVSPRSTKELMLQHGKLIALNDGEAWIKVSSTPLLLMAIQKLPDVESAFRKAFGTTVKIRLEV